jgi:hypothetical protein
MAFPALLAFVEEDDDAPADEPLPAALTLTLVVDDDAGLPFTEAEAPGIVYVPGFVANTI